MEAEKLSNMQSPEDRAAMLRLAQIYRCLLCNESHNEKIIEAFERLCKTEGNNNHILPVHTVDYSDYAGNPILHFVAYLGKSGPLHTLLDNNADFTLKNKDGFTALHFVAAMYRFYLERELQYQFDDIKILLDAHIKFNNLSNPCCNNGISHFHIACMIDKVEVIEFFLKNGISADHAVNADSDRYAGYTPLHFAARFCCLETVDVLLKHGANIFIKDAKGMTPLHILIKRNMKIYDIIIRYKEDGEDKREPTADLLRKIEVNEIIIKLLLRQVNEVSEALFFESVGMSRFHIFCTMQDSLLVESLLEYIPDIHLPVPENSLVWPGYTALHFAANCNIETVKILMMVGANIEMKDAKGVTPLSICLFKQEIKEIIDVMSHKLEWKHIHFSDRKMKLLNLLFALQNRSEFSKFLESKEINASISLHAPLWPGYTPLHLAVLFSRRFSHTYRRDHYLRSEESPLRYPLVTECLSRGADVTIQDRHGSTPLHLAFKLEKAEIVEILLKSYHKNIDLVDKDGLSILLMACATNKTELAIRHVNKENVNIIYTGQTIFKYYNCLNYGNTPLHIAVEKRNVEIVKILLENGADVNKPNTKGETPIHIAALDKSVDIGSELIKASSDFKNHVIPGFNFTYLHAACRLKNLHLLKEMIRIGEDVNASMIWDENHDEKDYKLRFFREHKDWTPLHLAVAVADLSIVKVLIEAGADILAKGHDYVIGTTSSGIAPLLIALEPQYKDELVEFLFETIENDDSLKKRMKRDFGITLLHIACYVVNLEAVQRLLKRRANVNAQVHEDSAVWAGFTPLHVLMRRTEVWSNDLKLEKNADEIVKLLLSKGADVTLATACGNTPIHFSFEPFNIDEDELTSWYITYRTQMNLPEHSRVKMLMEAHKNFKVNPVNSEGISHFHIAVAIDDLDAAEKFLKHKLNVNQVTGYFNECAAGYTPLHYAIDLLSHKTFSGSPEYPMVELLLSHGADPNIEDLCGNTPLHLALCANAPRTKLVHLLVNHGADITKKNLCSQTPFQGVHHEKNCSRKWPHHVPALN